MKCMYIAAIAAALVSATLFTGCEKKEPTLGDKIAQAGKEAGKTADKTTADAGKAADKAAADASKAADAAAKDLNKTLGK